MPNDRRLSIPGYPFDRAVRRRSSRDEISGATARPSAISTAVAAFVVRRDSRSISREDSRQRLARLDPIAWSRRGRSRPTDRPVFMRVRPPPISMIPRPMARGSTRATNRGGPETARTPPPAEARQDHQRRPGCPCASMISEIAPRPSGPDPSPSPAGPRPGLDRPPSASRADAGSISPADLRHATHESPLRPRARSRTRDQAGDPSP